MPDVAFSDLNDIISQVQTNSVPAVLRSTGSVFLMIKGLISENLKEMLRVPAHPILEQARQHK